MDFVLLPLASANGNDLHLLALATFVCVKLNRLNVAKAIHNTSIFCWLKPTAIYSALNRNVKKPVCRANGLF